MIHTKELQFTYKDIDIEATITYGDKAFSAGYKSEERAFYNVALHKPIEMECGGEDKTINGIASMMLFRAKKEYRYAYSQRDDELKEGEVNVFPKAIEKILYSYFNKEQIVHYKKQVKIFADAIDKKYIPRYEEIRMEKLALKQRLRSGEIDSKTYQKLYKPIRLRMDEMHYKMVALKQNYKQRYFQCCELKEQYRKFKGLKIQNCDALYSYCEFLPYLAKTKKEQ